MFPFTAEVVSKQSACRMPKPPRNSIPLAVMDRAYSCFPDLKTFAFLFFFIVACVRRLHFFFIFRNKGVSSESVPVLGVDDRPSQGGAARAPGMRWNVQSTQRGAGERLRASAAVLGIWAGCTDNNIVMCPPIFAERGGCGGYFCFVVPVGVRYAV